jgi:outer membrane protein OmpA-like peptidoglycan-associated protein
VTCWLFTSLSAQAAGKGEHSRKWHLWAGADVGIGLLQTSVPGEANKSGYSADLKLLGSYYFPRWVAEAGGGIFRNRVSGERADGTDILIEHNSVYLELGARYLLGQSWELGGFGLLVFGDDLSFRPTVLPLRTEDPKKMLVALGAQALYRFNLWEDWLSRVGFRIGTDLSVADRQYVFAQGVIHIGLPIGSKTPDPFEIPATPTASKERKLKRVTLPRIQFDVSSYKLEKQSGKFLSDLGAFLAKPEVFWEHLTIEGHSDNRGDSAKNLELSQLRAEAVKQILVSVGTNAEKITAQGYGDTRPLIREDNPQSWLSNRRVEFLFSPDSDTDKIAREVLRLRDVHRL